MSEPFDFGFTAITEDELATVETSKKIAEESSAVAEENQKKLNKLYEAILPLLNNLKQNPEKPYILWPDRLSKIEQFENHLKEIVGLDI